MFLNKAVTSILTQTLTDWELIIFNNLKDRNLDYKDDRIKIIDNDNLPLVECLNLGTEMAKSNIIMHHCDDDISMPERAEITYNRINEGAYLFVGSFIAVNENLKLKYMYNPPYNLDLDDLVLRGNTVPLFCAGYRKDKAPRYREGFPMLHDYVFMLDFVKSGMKYASSLTPFALKIHHSLNFNKDKEDIKAYETEKLRDLYRIKELRSERVMTYL